MIPGKLQIILTLRRVHPLEDTGPYKSLDDLTVTPDDCALNLRNKDHMHDVLMITSILGVKVVGVKVILKLSYIEVVIFKLSYIKVVLY